jgi:tetratricopeptide (TPR) repeat protein
MALVIAASGAVGITAFPEPAHAQDENEERKPEYSKEFIAAYQPVEAALKAEAPNPAAAKALIPALVAASKNADEKRATGGVMLNLGNETDDAALRLQGIELMLESGILEPKLEGQLSFAAYQAYRDENNVAAARTALERAIAVNHTFEATMTDGSQRTFGADDMRTMIADLYFDQGNFAEGLAYLSEQIEERNSAGGQIPENWIRKGLSTAYENEINDVTPKYVAMLAENYPSDVVWGDAVIVTLNANSYQNPEVLDLLRLSRRTKAYNDARVLTEFVEILDPRRYPGEVVSVIDEGSALGVIDKSDPFIAETRTEAAGRVETDRADLPSLATDARASGANLKTLVVAGDTFLSYDKPAEAEEFYTKALGMSGVETPLVLTRLGIAQYDQGKYAEAVETFNKVEGARKDIANLWAIYAAQKAGI